MPQNYFAVGEGYDPPLSLTFSNSLHSLAAAFAACSAEWRASSALASLVWRSKTNCRFHEGVAYRIVSSWI